jgi:flagellar biosynthesis/type III secretory pathway M-ring protein FliF/YscJ
VSDAESPPSFVELQQQVATLVQQDPASAAEVLRHWLSRAA